VEDPGTSKQRIPIISFLERNRDTLPVEHTSTNQMDIIGVVSGQKVDIRPSSLIEHPPEEFGDDTAAIVMYAF
jgi:hypothetical protein